MARAPVRAGRPISQQRGMSTWHPRRLLTSEPATDIDRQRAAGHLGLVALQEVGHGGRGMAGERGDVAGDRGQLARGDGRVHGDPGVELPVRYAVVGVSCPSRPKGTRQMRRRDLRGGIAYASSVDGRRPVNETRWDVHRFDGPGDGPRRGAAGPAAVGGRARSCRPRLRRSPTVAVPGAGSRDILDVLLVLAVMSVAVASLGLYGERLDIGEPMR
jgi:hypothetical protein